MKSIFAAIDGRVLMLQANNLKDEPDIFIDCQDLSFEVKNDDEVECFGVLMLIMEELRPIVDVSRKCHFFVPII